MTFSLSRPRISACAPLAIVSTVSVLAVGAASAQTDTEPTLAPVIVTASRFASDPAFRPIGATVITAEQIHDAGINNVNEAIRKIGGVYGRQSLNGDPAYSLDLRGFGTTSDQNLVVLVDGIRISQNEQTTALFSSIPIESVERIEIVHGGSSVLYGEGATGGTIQILTKRASGNALHGTVAAEAGTYADRQLRASLTKGWNGLSMDLNASRQQSDNYRDNSAASQNNFSGGLQWGSREGRIGMRVDTEHELARLPGSLTLAQFESNPRQTTSPNDFGSFDLNRYTLFAERHLEAWDLAADLSQSDKATNSVFSGSPSRMNSRTTQFSPRLRNLHAFHGGKNELVIGMDFARWTRRTNNLFSRADASQNSQALYMRDEIRIGKARIAAGARHERFSKSSVDPLPFSSDTYDKSQALNAWELQSSYDLMPRLQVFAKAGQSYRVANADDNAFTPTPNVPLQPQTSHDLELGTMLGKAARKLVVKVFQHRLTNEILYDPTKFANVNLDPTKRQGVEVEASTPLASNLVLSANLQHLSARFSEGPNAGNEIVLVPRNTALFRVNWMPENGQSAYAGLQWVDSQRYGGDFSNTCAARMPAYTTLDARYAKRVGAWEFAVAGANLTDRKYFSNAFGTCQSGIYPDAGRQIKVSATLNF